MARIKKISPRLIWILLVLGLLLRGGPAGVGQEPSPTTEPTLETPSMTPSATATPSGIPTASETATETATFLPSATATATQTEAPSATPLPASATPPLQITAPTTLLSESFEADSGLWTISGSGNRVNFEPAHEGQWSFSDSPGFPYAANTTTMLSLNQAIGLPMNAHIRLHYWQRVDLALGDSVQVQVSTDQVNWTTLKSASAVRNLAWTIQVANLSAYANRALWLRFVVSSDADINTAADGWWLDDIAILAEPLPLTYATGLGELESDDPAWWWLDGNWQVTPSPVQSGATSWASGAVPETASALTLQRDLNLSGLMAPTLHFWQTLNLGSGDQAQIELSADSGQTWQFLALYTPLDNTNAWAARQVDLTAYKGQPLRVRFLLIIDGDGVQGSGWIVDGISVQELSTLPTATATTIVETVTPSPDGTAPVSETATPTSSETASPTAGTEWVTFADNDPRLVYANGTWQAVEVAAAQDGTLTYTQDANATMSVYFEGVGIRLVYSKGNTGGTFSAEVDGGEPQSADGFSPDLSYGHLLTFDGLAAGPHVLTLTNGSGDVWIEAVEIQQGTLLEPAAATATPSETPSPGTEWVMYDDTDPRLVYANGTWETVPVAAAVNGTLTYTQDANATVMVYFEGVGIRLVYSQGDTGGPFSAEVDGGAPQSADGFSPDLSYGYRLTFEGLAPGPHILTLTNGSSMVWIEAVEIQGTLSEPPTPTAAPTETFTPTATPICTFSIGNEDVTGLINALDQINANCTAGEIDLAPSVYTLTTPHHTSSTNIGTGLPAIATDISINGHNATIQRDSTAANFRIFEVTTGGILTLNDLTVSGGKLNSTASGSARLNDSGAAIAVFSADVNLNHVTLKDNRVDGAHGGALLCHESLCTITDSLLENNVAGSAGGAIAAYGSSETVVRNSTLRNNHAGGDGGAIYLQPRYVNPFTYRPLLRLEQASILNGNIAEGGAGGVIYADDADIIIADSALTHNTSAGNGGAIQGYSLDVDLTNSFLDDNITTDGAGGALQVYYSTVDMTGGSISRNTSGGWDGGAIHSRYTNLNLTNVILDDNIAPIGDGGAIYSDDAYGATPAIVTLTNVSLNRNHSRDYGGAIAIDDGTLTLIDTTLTDNQTTLWDGGAIYMGGDSLSLLRVYMASNTAGYDGGALYIAGYSPVTITDSAFYFNQAAAQGGFLYSYTRTHRLENSCVVGNRGAQDRSSVYAYYNNYPLEASNNWWGAPDGPSGQGPGTGDAVFNVTAATFTSFQTTVPAHCPLDTDNDGLTDAEEQSLQTQPDNRDSDGDGLLDGPEVHTYLVLPLVTDSDQDGLNDGGEVYDHHTDPAVADTDKDGLNDGEEVLTYSTNPIVADSDGDGYSDGYEVANGSDPTDPTSLPACVREVAGGNVDELISALQFINFHCRSGGTVNLTNSIYSLTTPHVTTYPGVGLPVIDAKVTIEGHGATITRASNAPGFRIFEIKPNQSLTLKNITISNGLVSSSNGAGVYVAPGATLTLENSVFSNHATNNNGGAIYNQGGTVGITNSTLLGNKASPYFSQARGGAIYSTNYTYPSGGAFYPAVLVITGSHFENNQATPDGGAIWASGQTTITASTFSTNTASNNGGAVLLSGTAEVKQSTFSGNRGGSGGAISASNTTLTITDSSFDNNRATNGNGGAIAASGQTTITASTFSANTAGLGGALYLTGTSALISDSHLLGNTASTGGAIYTTNTTVSIETTVASNNVVTGATGQGSTLYSGTRSITTPVSLSDNCFINNNATSIFANPASTFPINAMKNWWGAATGPRIGTETGVADKVSSYVDYLDWLTAAPAICPNDTDHDGLPDHAEVAYGTDPNDPDSDDDGLLDGEEVTTYQTNPNDLDSDDDTLSDWDEVNTYHTDPNQRDSDDDTVLDAVDNCALLANPDQADLDGDGIGDACDPDVDGDGVDNTVDNCPLDANADQADSDGDGQGDACEPGAPAPLYSTITVSPEMAAATGDSPITLTVLVRDANNRIVDGIPVTFSASSESQLAFTPATVITDSNGAANAQVTSNLAGIKTVQVEAAGVSLGSAIVQFWLGDPTVEVHGLTQVVAGQNVIYRVDVRNDGFVATEQVSVTAGLPLGQVSFESEQHPANTSLVMQVNNQVIWNIPSLPAGETYAFYVVGRTAKGLTLNTALKFGALVSASVDALHSNNEAQATTTVKATSAEEPGNPSQPEKIVLTYSAVQSPVNVGGNATLQVTATNITANETLYNVQLWADMSTPFKSLQAVWPNPAFPSRLRPGESATATFTVLLTPDFAPAGKAQVSAADSDPGDGAPLIAAQTDFNTVSLQIDGPGLLVEVIPDRADPSTYYVGETATFTVQVTNASQRREAATNVQVWSRLTSETLALPPLAPGETATTSFSDVMTANDIPLVSAWVDVTAQGADSGVTGSASERAQVNVLPTDTADPSSPNLVLAMPSRTGAIPGFPLTLSLEVHNVGQTPAQDTRAILTLPPGVSLTEASPADLTATATYDTTTRQVTWQLGEMASQTQVLLLATVQVASDVPLGSSLTFDGLVATTYPELNYADNSVTLTVPVVAQQPAASSTLAAVDRAWLIADGRDLIQVEVVAHDVLNQPLAGIPVIFSVDQPGITITPSSGVTDTSGALRVTIQATEPGIVTLSAELGHGLILNLPLERRPSAMTMPYNTLEVGVGGSAKLPITLLNTTGTGDVFAFALASVSSPTPGDDSWLSWLTLTPAPLPLSANQSETTTLRVNVPAAACDRTGTYDLTLTATGQNSGVLGTAQVRVNVSASPPALDAVTPAMNGRISGTEILFSWRSNTPGNATVYLRAVGETTFTSYPMSQNPADSTLWTVSVQPPAEGNYEWYGDMQTGCGTSSVGAPGSPRLFSVVQAVTFVDRAYEFTIRDDYDQTTDVDGQLLAIRVRNDTNVSRSVMVDVDSPYTDLIAGFTGSGSIEQAAILAPHEVRTLTLRVFTQHIQQPDYGLTLTLTSGMGENAVTDTVPLTLHIQPPQFVVNYAVTAVDPITRVHQVTLTNNGDTLTDFNLQLLDEDGVPVNAIVNPSLQHVYFQAGTSIEIEIIPLELLAGDATANANIISDDQHAISYRAQDAPSAASSNLALLSIRALMSAAGQVLEVPNALNPQCPGAVESSCKMAWDMASKSWYCTNRPNIDEVFTVPPYPLANLSSATVTFHTGGGDGIYEHTTELRFNTTPLGSVTITGNEQNFTVDIPPEAFNTVLADGEVVRLSSQQTLNLRSIHPNLAHYIVASAFSLSLRFSDGSSAGQEIVLTGGQLQQQDPEPTATPGCGYCKEVAQAPEPVVISCNALPPYPVPGFDPSLNLLPIYFDEYSTTYLPQIGNAAFFVKRGWLGTPDNLVEPVRLTVLDKTNQPDSDGYIWYQVAVPAGWATNIGGGPYGSAMNGWVQASQTDGTNETKFLLPESALESESGCEPPTPPPPLDIPEGPAICEALQAELTDLGVLALPDGVNLQYDAYHPILNDASKFSDNFTYGRTLTYTQGDSLPTDLVKVAPCTYEDSFYHSRVVRFGTNALIMTLEEDFSGDTVEYEKFLQAAQYSLILNYANYYATGPTDGIHDFCFQGDNLYQRAVDRATIPSEDGSDDGTRYNIPVPWVNCDVRDPLYTSEGDGPCGTLPSAAYRAMGYFKIRDFNPPKDPYDLGQYYFSPVSFETMFKAGTKYVISPYEPIRIDFYNDGNPITFTRDGWHPIVYRDKDSEGNYAADNNGYDPDVDEFIRNEAIWNSYTVDRTSETWQNIKPGDIVNFFTNQAGLSQTNVNDSQGAKPGEGAYHDQHLHVQIVVGWGPDRPDLPNGEPNSDYAFSSWKENYQGELYATWYDLPEHLRDGEGTDDYVPYVIDRGLRKTDPGVEDYAIRGPHPFHSQYSISHIEIWVSDNKMLTRR